MCVEHAGVACVYEGSSMMKGALSERRRVSTLLGKARKKRARTEKTRREVHEACKRVNKTTCETTTARRQGECTEWHRITPGTSERDRPIMRRREGGREKKRERRGAKATNDMKMRENSGEWSDKSGRTMRRKGYNNANGNMMLTWLRRRPLLHTTRHLYLLSACVSMKVWE